MFYKRRIDECTSVELTVARASNRRLNERRIDGYKRQREYELSVLEATFFFIDVAKHSTIDKVFFSQIFILFFIRQNKNLFMRKNCSLLKPVTNLCEHDFNDQ